MIKIVNKKMMIFFISILLGFILIQQFYLHIKVSSISQPEVGNSLALEVAELIKNTEKLSKDNNRLGQQLDKLTASAINTQTANDTLKENLNNYKIILGLTDIDGVGVTITFNQELDSTQVIDLINTIKNIGAEAIAINNKRITPTSSIDNGIYYPPTQVQIIGNPDILKDSLSRAGGMVDQIGFGDIEKKDQIFLKASNK